jgi:hypothetical protein
MPPANENWDRKGDKKTYDENKPANSANPGDSDRTKSDTGLDGSQTGVNGGENTVNRVQQAGGAEETSPATKINPRNDREAPAATPFPKNDDESGSNRLPPLNLDEKVASRAAPERKRITLNTNVTSARLIRVPAYPKSEWTPVDADAKVAKN